MKREAERVLLYGGYSFRMLFGRSSARGTKKHIGVMAIIKNGFLVNTSKNVAGTVYYKYKGTQFSRSMPQLPEKVTGTEKQKLVQSCLGTISSYIANHQPFASWLDVNYYRRGKRYRGTGRDRVISWCLNRVFYDIDGDPYTWSTVESNHAALLNDTGAWVLESLRPSWNSFEKLPMDVVSVSRVSSTTGSIHVSCSSSVLQAYAQRQRDLSPRSFKTNTLYLAAWGNSPVNGQLSPIELAAADSQGGVINVSNSNVPLGSSSTMKWAVCLPMNGLSGASIYASMRTILAGETYL